MLWIVIQLYSNMGFPGGMVVKKKKKKIYLPGQEKQETWVQSLGQKDPVEEEMTTHSSILAWEILCYDQRSLAGYSPRGQKE